MKIEWLTHEPEDLYHARSKSGEILSSHMLADFRNSPLLYHKKITGQVIETSNPAYALGSATHKLILEGREAFDAEYIVADGPINEKTGKPFGPTSQKYQLWLEEQTKEVVAPEDFGKIMKMYHGVHSNLEAARLLETGEAEGVVRAELNAIPCQIRIDWLNPEMGIVDLKTTAELRYFESDCRRYGYINQLAFYRAVVRAITGVTMPVFIIAVEKIEPYAAGVWMLTSNALDDAEQVNSAAMVRMKDCICTNIWPTGYESVRVIDSL